MTPDPQQRSLVGTRRFATTVIGTWGVVLWNPWTRQLKSDLTRPPVVLCYCAESILCPDMVQRPVGVRGKELTVPR